MSSEFQNKIKKDYTENKHWKKTIRQLKQAENVKIIEFSYFMNDDLIYYIDLIDSCCHLCIFKSLEKEIFQMIHDKYHHVSFHWVYNTIVASLFIQSLSWQLSQYIIHCLQCQHYQIIWHWSYKVLQLIIRLPISFHTVTADFIIELLKTKNRFDAVITMICKFSKKIKFILNKKT